MPGGYGKSSYMRSSDDKKTARKSNPSKPSGTKKATKNKPMARKKVIKKKKA